MDTKTFNVVGMHCVSCSTGIRKLVSKVKGVRDVEVVLSESKLIVSYDQAVEDQVVKDAVARLGYKAELKSED